MGIGLGVDLLITSTSPLPPSRRASGPKCVRANAWHGALGGPFFDNFVASISGSILGSFWIRFGLVLDLFWIPFGSSNRVKLGQECVLSGNFFENADFHADLRFPMFFLLFLPQDGTQDRLKTGPRRVQER